VLAGSLVAQDRALARDVRALDPATGAVRATWGGFAGQTPDRFPALDRDVRRTLTPITGRAPTAVLAYREQRVGGALVDLAAVDGVRRLVRLRSGRLPRPCAADHCEVVQVGGSGPLPAGTPFVRVGSGKVVSQAAFGDTLRTSPPSEAAASALAYHAPKQPPILLAEGVAGLGGAFPDFDSIYRTYSWFSPVAPDLVPPWGVGAFSDRVARARSALLTRSDLFDLSAPVEELEAARDSARVAGRRLLLIGGEAAALLLAFVLLAAAGASRDVEAGARRLTWFGAGRGQLLLVFAAEALLIGVAGAGTGWLLGAAVGAAIAAGAGAPTGGVLSHSVLSWTGLAVAACATVGAAAVLLAALRPSRARVGPMSIGLVDVAAAGALAAIVLALVRGGTDADALAREEGTGVVLLLLPGLVAFVAAVVCIRLLAPALRGLERATRRSRTSVSLAALSLARAPGRSAVAVAFLVVCTGLALFAAVYRSTLLRNQADEAAFAVPLDFTLQEDFGKVVYPLDAAPLERYETLGPGVRAHPVIRLYADASRSGPGGVTVLGVPAAALPRLKGWRAEFSNRTPAQLGQRIAPRGDVDLRGLHVPEGARELLLPVAARGESVRLSGSVATDDGDFELVDFGLVAASGPKVLHASVPKEARGGTLVGFSLDPPTYGERVPFGRSIGAVDLGALQARTPAGVRTVGGFARWIGVNGVKSHPLPGGTRLDYLVTSALESRFRPRQPTDGRPLPVVVSPDLVGAAGPDGLLPLRFVGQQVETRIAAVAHRFPTTTGSFAIADERSLAATLNASSPGSGLVVELWVDGGASPARVERELGGAPFNRLALTSRRGVEAGLRADPLARGSLITLAATAIVALLLALAGLLLAVLADLRDEAGELAELEAQGAGPALLRGHLRLRALVVAAAGVIGGLVTGTVLSLLVVRVVRLTAGAEAPDPPLRLDVDWALVAFGLVGFIALAGATVALVTWLAFRSPGARPAESLS
jgi:hypothetical protein